MSDLVVVSLEAWDDIWRRNQHIVSRLTASDPDLRVLFIEPPDDPLHDLRRRRRPRWGRRLTPVAPRVWAVRGVKALPRRLDRRADSRLADGVFRAAARLGMTAPTLWINDPVQAGLATRTGWPTVYDITDDWAAADRPDAEHRRVVEGERMLLRDAAEVIACSAELRRRKQPLRGPGRQPVEVIPNGVDVEAYRTPHSRPTDLPAGRTAVYVGTLHPDRLDVALCVTTGLELGDTVRLVLVGPNLLGSAVSDRLARAGVVVLGGKPRDAVIGYLQHADVLVVPHLVDAFTDSLDPIKLYEYRAVGRRIVSTAVAGFRDDASGSTIISSAAGFPDAVREAALAGVTEPTAVPAGGEETDWSARARRFASVLARASASPR